MTSNVVFTVLTILGLIGCVFGFIEANAHGTAGPALLIASAIILAAVIVASTGKGPRG